MKKKYLRYSILLVLAFQLSLGATTVFAAEYKTSGTVMDENGNILTGVEVIAYDTASSSYKQKTNTNSIGYFKLILPEGEYDLVFNKPGYATYTTTVNSITDDVLFRSIEMTNALQLDISTANRVTTPGTSLNIPFTVSNAGENRENCQFSISTPTEWSAAIVDQISEIAGVQLFAGDIVSLNLEIVVPLTATGENTIQLLVSGTTSWTEWSLTISVEDEESPILGCEYPNKSGNLGSSVQFSVDIQNPFDLQTNFSLGVLNAPEAWDITIRNSQQEIVNSVNLEANQKSDVIIIAEIPETSSYDAYSFVMITTSPYRTDALQLKVLVTQNVDFAKIQAKYPSQSIPLGSTASYLLTIENPSQTDELFDLSAPEIPAGWQIVFKATEHQEIGAVLIAANGEEIITAEVTPSLTSALGEYLFPIEATSQSVQGSIILKAIVSGSYDVDLAISALFVEIDAGNTETVTVEVTNTGYSPLTNVEIIITSTPPDWTVEPSPLKHPTLNPNDSIEFHVDIQIPAEVARGDYLVNFRPVMDQISPSELGEQEIRVTANPEAATGIYGLALAMIALAAMFLVLMKFRRR